LGEKLLVDALQRSFDFSTQVEKPYQAGAQRAFVALGIELRQFKQKKARRMDRVPKRRQ
jgi:hypothetical protein